MEQTEEYRQKQQQRIAESIAKSDIVITTALIPGRPALAIIPSDTYYANQWYLEKVRAVDAWDKVREAPGTVVAVIDTGIDVRHPDLADNIWVNRREVPGNGLDDDGNGYVDDVNGYDFANFDSNPNDDVIGAAANPFADPFEIRVPRLAKKIKAGAEFIQTQCIYNLEKFELWMQQVVDRGLHEQAYIMAGLTPMKSAGMARYMKNRVPGMDVPDEVVKRLADTPKDKQAEEGIKICVESIQRLKQVEGVRGFHIIALECVEKVP